MKFWKTFGIVIVILILLGTGFYFTKINNIFAIKPDIEKPEVDVDFIEQNLGVQVIQEEHIEYLANELGSYKLHEDSGEDAVIVFDMIDIGISFALVKDGETYITEDIPEVVDIIIRGEQIVIARLIESRDLISALMRELEAGNIEIEIISDESTLALKGYLAIYENFV